MTHPELGTFLRTTRESSGRSLRSVARALGITAPYLSCVERGISGVAPDRLDAFAAAYGCDPAALAALYRCPHCGRGVK